MKKFLLTLIGVWFYIQSVSAQQTPQTALMFTSWLNQGIQASLTDSSFGPSTPGINYGSLGSNGRYAWTFIPVCDSNQVEIITYSISYTDTVGYSIYGPFQDTINILGQIQASNPIAARFYHSGLMGGMALIPNLGRGLYYIVWNINPFTGTKPIFARIVSPQASNNLCNFCNAAFDIQQTICLITLDSATQRNQLIWDKGDTTNLEGFILFRENNISGQYDSLTFIHKDSANYFIDLSANPATRNWRYMLHRYDQCGYRLPAYYQGGGYVFRTNTIHLQQGVSTNNSINLTWNNYVNNSPNPGSGGFIQSFYIYRSNGAGPFICIDSVPSTNASYTDVNPNQGLNLYQVAMKKITPCNIIRSAAGESRSNIVSTTFTGIEDPVQSNFFSITPNPATDKLNVEVGENVKGWNLRIINAAGQLELFQSGIQMNNLPLNCEKLRTGFYIVEIEYNGNYYFKKLIIN
ncbi:MAG TPA: T9SS type A sorting domain-containing protein [Chitinophagales bacterium]|nr:T9SS type A sorting domain-containing protein [Chitinophagales bacterium]